MNLSVAFKQMDATDALKDYVFKKMDKLQKFFHKPLKVDVVLLVEKLDHIAEVTVTSKDLNLTISEKSHDLYVSIDTITDKIERHLIRQNKKVKNHKRRQNHPIDDVEDLSTAP